MLPTADMSNVHNCDTSSVHLMSFVDDSSSVNYH